MALLLIAFTNVHSLVTDAQGDMPGKKSVQASCSVNSYSPPPAAAACGSSTCGGSVRAALKQAPGSTK